MHAHTHTHAHARTHTHTHTHIGGGIVVKNLRANTGYARNAGLIPGLGRVPGAGNGNPLRYSCLEDSMDKGAWQVTDHGVAKSWT